MNGVPHSSVSNAWKRKGPLMLPGSNVWNVSSDFFRMKIDWVAEFFDFQ
jgi:hypothetical protein